MSGDWYDRPRPEATSEPMAYPFVMQPKSRTYVEAPHVKITWREKRRNTRPVADLFVMTEHAGWDHSQIRIEALGRYPNANMVDHLPVRDGSGRSALDKLVHASATAAGIKKVLRRVRPQERATLDRIDNRIVDLQRELAAARTKRKAVLAEAWRNGHVVRLNEVRPVSDDEPRRLES